jgi:hypothetical protein
VSKIVSNYTANGSSTSDEYGTFVVLNRLLQGDVVQGFQVVPNGTPNMTVLVNPGSGRISTGTAPANYGYLIAHDTVAGELVTIATASASPRIDYIVAYIDKSVVGSTSGTYVNNTNNVLKFASVAGTPAGSPVVPTVAQIQAAIGATNPYSIYAQVAVGASVTAITTPNITDTRTMATISAIAPGAVTPDKRSGGFFAANVVISSTGTQTITGIGFTPKAIIITGISYTSTTDTFLGSGYCFYNGVSYIQSSSGTYIASTPKVVASSGAFCASNATGAFYNTANVTGFSSGTVTLNVTVAAGSVTYMVMVLG